MALSFYKWDLLKCILKKITGKLLVVYVDVASKAVVQNSEFWF